MNSNAIFNIQSNSQFEKLSLQVFEFQYQQNQVYRTFCNHLKKTPENVISITNIPFLPIQFFKSHKVISSTNRVQEIFTSSGTTGTSTSKHYVTDLSIYEKSYLKGFEYFYGNIQDYAILGLLPSYLERKGSSLIYMVDDLIKRSKNPDSGFYLHNTKELKEKLLELNSKNQKTLLIGVSFALLDFIEKYQLNLKNTLIMETGGMKGQRKELIREELHQILCTGFGVTQIQSEYGMTELLSQAYSSGDGIFKCPPWMKVLTRDTQDPLTLNQYDKTGGINVIDLANINSCSFIATQDLGKVKKDGSFKILGRFDNSDIRGCNLMVM